MTAESTLSPTNAAAPPKEPWATRFSDWLNPIVVKELRQAVQSRFVVAALLILLTIQILAVGIYLLTAGDPATNFDAGRTVFLVLFGILLAVSMLFVPLYTGVRLAAERSETNLDLMFITTLRPRSIIAGKLLAAVTLAGLVFSACLPFMTFTYFLRGIDLPSMLVVLVLGFVVVLVSAQMAIFVACIPVNRAVKAMMALAVFLLFTPGYFATMAGSSQLITRGVGSQFASAQFWQWVGIFGLNFLGLLGLLFVLSVALIMPPSANRALPVRMYLTGLWALGGVAALIGSYVENTHDPVVFWQGAFNILFAISLFVAVSERDWPGRRVLRRVPPSGLKRLIFFFLSSGSASGLAWTCAAIAATYGICWAWWRLFPVFSDLDDLVDATRWFTVMNLYLLCYALTGALLRRHLFRRVGTELTWLLSTVLAALGSTIPFLIGALFFLNNLTWWNQDYGKWLVGNPFAWDVKAYRELYLSVGVVWGLLVVAFSLHWFLKRVRYFRSEAATEIA